MSLEDDADCHFGDHDFREPRGCTCRHCGYTNYALLGWYGAVASAAKRWGCSGEDAETRIIRGQIARDIKRAVLEGTVEARL